MKVSFTATDFQAALIEFQQQTGMTCQLSGHESTLMLPKSLGEGRVSNINLRAEGLDLFIRRHLLNENLLIAAAASSPDHSPVVLKFFLSGLVDGTIQGIKADVSTIAGQYCFVYCADQAGHVEFVAGKDICAVEIMIAPHLFQEMLGEDLQMSQFQQWFNPHALKPYWKLGKTSPSMAIALQQILHCPYQGATRRLYLESKSLELITLAFEHCKTQEPMPKKQRSLKPEDVQVMHQARDILINQMHNPPSLLSLAQQVGINDCKLKQGFRQVFGMTVFGYLHDYRMERAAELLQGNQMTVTGVAAAVGFANRSAFAVAFRRKFGLNPSDYQATYRQQYWHINSAKNSG
ncbi:MAG: AraC family transcriptional regulator [Cyanobacteria bacterium P01_C01_bin.70]